MPAPSFEKRNEFTDIINQVKDANASRGALAGRGIRPIPIEGGPAVRSAAMARPPLPPAEKERLDKLAAAQGIGPGDEPEGAEAVVDILREALTPLAPPNMNKPSSFRSLPDFTRVQALDLVNGIAIVDGMEFAIPEDDIRDMKGYVVQLVTDAITARVADALIAFGLPQRSSGGTDGTTETVREVQGGEGQGRFLQGLAEIGRTFLSVQSVPGPTQSDATEAGTESSVDAGVQGDNLATPESPRVFVGGSPNPIDFVVSPEGEVHDLRDAGVASPDHEDVAAGGLDVQPDSHG